MKAILDFIERLYNSIKYNGLFILLSIIFPIIFSYFDAGRDIMNSLLLTETGYTILLTALSFIILSLSTWCVPVLAILLFSFMTGQNVQKYKLFANIESYYNKKPTGSEEKELEPQIPGKYLALIPWCIFNISLIMLLDDSYKFQLAAIYTIFLGAIIYIINYLYDNFANMLTKFIATENEKWYFFFISIGVFVCYLIFALAFNSPIDKTSLTHGLLAMRTVKVCLYISLGTILMYIFLNTFEFINHNVQTEKSFHFRSSLYIHIICILGSLLFYLAFYILNRQSILGVVNPIVVSIMLSSFVILLLELFFTAQLVIIAITGAKSYKIKFYKYLVICATLLCVFAYFFYSSNDSLIRRENISNFNRHDYKRATLEQYFDGWYKDRTQEKPNDTLKIFLISGQGGGSRAATWFLGNMLMFDRRAPNFHNNIFSVSTVSGSSSGALMYLAFKNIDAGKFRNDHNKSSIENLDNTDLKVFISDIYSQNYLSSGLFGLLMNDFTLDFATNILLDENRDRNYSLQKEEMKNFENAYYRFRKINENGQDSIRANIYAFFEKDYMQMYNNPATRYKHPLFFINTTLLSSGSKGVFSPVILQNSASSEDVYGNFRNCTHSDNEALPLVACVNQSQAFPFLNSYNFLHGSGRLGDGGMWENTGTETTLLVYQKLKEHIKNKKYKAVIYVITLNNGEIVENADPIYTKPSVLNTISALTKSPFYGREFLSFQALKREVPEYHHIQSAPKKNYSLTRFLNKKHFSDIMLEMSSSQSNSTSNAANAIDGILSRKIKSNSRIYIQYVDSLEASKVLTRLKSDFDKSEIKPLEKIESKVLQNYVRFFHKTDSLPASQIANSVNINKSPKDRYTLQDFSGRYKYVPEGQIEIWIK